VSEERNLRVSKSELKDLDEALAWAVQTVDRDFSGATMINLSVEQMMRSGPGVDDPWEYLWTASVGGMIEDRP
jgi:hypothetical protein